MKSIKPWSILVLMTSFKKRRVQITKEERRQTQRISKSNGRRKYAITGSYMANVNTEIMYVIKLNIIFISALSLMDGMI